jgi:hypothetical protein
MSEERTPYEVPDRTPEPSKSHHAPAGCMLGQELGDCPAKRAGCHSHYEMLKFMMPPWAVREHIKSTMGDGPAVRQWLARLDAVLSSERPSNGRRWEDYDHRRQMNGG